MIDRRFYKKEAIGHLESCIRDLNVLHEGTKDLQIFTILATLKTQLNLLTNKETA